MLHLVFALALLAMPASAGVYENNKSCAASEIVIKYDTPHAEAAQIHYFEFRSEPGYGVDVSSPNVSWEFVGNGKTIYGNTPVVTCGSGKMTVNILGQGGIQLDLELIKGVTKVIHQRNKAQTPTAERLRNHKPPDQKP